MAELMVIFLIGTFLQGISCHPGDVGIIGGHEIVIQQAPFMASLRLNGSYHWCGASIIHERFVLTAAHCIVPNRAFKVLVGTDNINGKGDLFEIEELKIHEKYNNKTYEFDFCLIKLKESVNFGPKVAKINLATTDLKLPKGTVFNITGWGSTESNSVSPKLLQVEIPLINKRVCRIKYAYHKFNITPKMICAGTLGHDSCQGDSGGPLTLGDIQVGVTSFGVGCGILPGVYGRVSSVNAWITEKIENDFHH